jgi:histidine triad (HIT) family protein
VIDPDCIFCKIGTGEAATEVVARTEDTVAFRDTNPQAPTHVLLIPTEHVASIAEAASSGDVVPRLVSLAAQVAQSEGLTDGWRLVANVGPAGGQTVQHLHLHLLGGRQMHWPPG